MFNKNEIELIQNVIQKEKIVRRLNNRTSGFCAQLVAFLLCSQTKTKILMLYNFGQTQREP